MNDKQKPVSPPVAEAELKPKRKEDAQQPVAEGERDMVLSRADAKAGSPSDCSVTGEEDPGVGLEFLVRKDI